MLTTILAGLVAAALIAAVAERPQPQPPQIIYVQAAPAEPEPAASGCLPLLALAAIILAAIALA